MSKPCHQRYLGLAQKPSAFKIRSMDEAKREKLFLGLRTLKPGAQSSICISKRPQREIGALQAEKKKKPVGGWTRVLLTFYVAACCGN